MEQTRPRIAVVTPNILTGIGLRSLLNRMMPGAEIVLFPSAEALAATPCEGFFHYFVSADAFVTNAPFFLDRIHKTIVLLHGKEHGHLPQQLHTLNICQSEEHLVRDFLRLAEKAHSARRPEVVERAKCLATTDSPLTPRETEVLHLIVAGHINKEIAELLHVSLATIISHRKNINEKLNAKSVSSLTIYAVTHGLIRIEEI